MQDEKRYPYDVFISYRWITPDKEWVREQLYPALDEAGLEVLLDVEDHVPGRDVMLEMERSKRESRRVLCVISPEYFEEGRMVGFESLMARRADPEGRYSTLIPLIVRETELPEWMRGLIPIIWTDPRDHAREWKKLLLTLGAPNLKVQPPAPVQAEPQNPSGVISPGPDARRAGRPSPRPRHGKKLRNAIYITAVLLFTTFSVLAVWQGFGGVSETIDSSPKATPQVSPQPTTAPTASPTATPTPSRSPSPSVEPASQKKGNVPPPPPPAPETNCSPRDRTLGKC
jgi:hypothetical protein